MYHWRTKSGQEVDLILKTEKKLYAIEIKGGRNLDKRDMKGLKLFKAEHPDSIPLCAATAHAPFLLDDIPVIPWEGLFGEEYLAGGR